ECPLFLVDDSGNKHSWRILTAPYVVKNYHGAKRALEKYNYRHNEPWDSKHNINEVDQLELFYYSCPADARSNLSSHLTSYVMLVRPPLESGRAEPLASDAVIVVESTGCGIG